MRKIIEDIIYDRNRQAVYFPLRFFLGILEIIYSFITFVRNILYDKNIFSSKDIPCRVVSIGNLTVGGTGKTPLVISTVKILKENGYSPVVISRGYKSGIKKPVVVSDGSNIFSGSIFPGDEPLIIADSVPSVPVVAGASRFDAAKLAYSKFKPDIILLDDGFQHRKLYRDVDLLTIDASTLMGNEHLLPRGILRESPYGINRASAVVVTRFSDDIKREKIERNIKYYDRNVNIHYTGISPAYLRKAKTKEIAGLDRLKGAKISALSNIANPEQFHKMIVSLGAEIVHKTVKPDHYKYGASEIVAIEANAMASGAEMLLLTAKDEYNIPDSCFPGKIDKLVLEIEVSFENVETYLKLICNKK